MSERLRIAVVGVGAIGSVVGARLAQAGQNVSLIARGARAKMLQEEGLRIAGAPQLSPPVRDMASVADADIVFVAVKEAAIMPLLVDLAKHVREGATIVPLVNGVPFWFDANPVPTAGIVGAVVFITASVGADGVVQPVGRERLILGVVEGVSGERLGTVAAMLREAGIDTVVSDNVRADVWSKVALNLATNPLSVVSRSSLEDQFNRPHLLPLVTGTLQEAIALARATGIEPSMTLDQMLETGRKAGAFFTSMFQDYETGRPLELDGIAWRCLDLGRRWGVPMPVAEAVAHLCAHAEQARDAQN